MISVKLNGKIGGKSSRVNGSAAATGNQMVQMLTNLPQKHEVSALCLKP
jgi:hypothetical protein